MKRINSYYCLTEALTKSVNKEALCVSQSMFSMEILSHFSRPSRSHGFGNRLNVLSQIWWSHGNSHNPNNKLTSWMFFYFSTWWRMFQHFRKQKQTKLIFIHLTGTNREVPNQCMTRSSYLALCWVVISQSNLWVGRR